MGHPSMPRWRYTVFRPCPFVLLRTTNINNKNYNANNLPKKQDFFLKKDFCKYNYIKQYLIMEKQRQQEEHIKVRKELRRRINKMIRLTLSDFKVEALERFDRNSRTPCLE